MSNLWCAPNIWLYKFTDISCILVLGSTCTSVSFDITGIETKWQSVTYIILYNYNFKKSKLWLHPNYRHRCSNITESTVFWTLGISTESFSLDNIVIALERTPIDPNISTVFIFPSTYSLHWKAFTVVSLAKGLIVYHMA